MDGILCCLPVSSWRGFTWYERGAWPTDALLVDGTVKCWGWNTNGQIGDGTIGIDRPAPTPVLDLADVIAIEAGTYSACALVRTGRVACWGYRWGSDPVVNDPKPVFVEGLSNASALAVGESHACVALTDGGAACWGSGPLGAGPTILQSAVPIRVTGLVDVVALAAGGSTCAALRDGSAECWGYVYFDNHDYYYAPAPITIICADQELTACDGVCTSLRSNAAHCGKCSHACPSGIDCVGAECACPSGTKQCGAACVDLTSDPQNCGSCGNVCPSGMACVAGACACPAGRTQCGGSACVDLSSDRAHCGECYHNCDDVNPPWDPFRPPSDYTCRQGQCACPNGGSLCFSGTSWKCRDLQNDSENYGACGQVCGSQICGHASCCPNGCPPGAFCDTVLGSCSCLQSEFNPSGTSDPVNGCCLQGCPPGATCTSSGRCVCPSSSSPAPAEGCGP